MCPGTQLVRFGGQCPYPVNHLTFFVVIFAAIAPFLADIDTSNGRGRILYREDTSPAVLGLAAQYVRTGFPLSAFNFTPTHAFLATWEHVGAYEEVRHGAAPSEE
ncbi:LOW QUALITY PROTEIN: hypothetical protein U0070_007800, partial [Myodes glareolus]